MKKKLLCIAMGLFLSFSVAACGSDKEDNSSTYERSAEKESKESEKESSSTETKESESSTESSSEESSSVESSSEESSSADSSSQESSAADSSSAESSAAESSEASENAEGKSYNLADYPEPFVNFDDMHFYVNGKKYTLGQTTLQEMIDDGVPFREKDLANAGNNLNPNYQSQGFGIELGEYYTAQVYTFNDTSENKVASECYINEIYLPVKQDKTQDILSFDFPLELTMEDLLANAGEPDENSHHDSDNGFYTDYIKYTRSSQKYYSNNKFEFDYTKGELNYIYIIYMP